MTVMPPDLEMVDLTELVGEVQTPCDNSELDFCPKDVARWAALIKCPSCMQSRWELWCTPCRDLVTTTEDGFECGQCGELVFPARRFVSKFEALGEKK